jgi:hypothetical protein
LAHPSSSRLWALKELASETSFEHRQTSMIEQRDEGDRIACRSCEKASEHVEVRKIRWKVHS